MQHKNNTNTQTQTLYKDKTNQKFKKKTYIGNSNTTLVLGKSP